MEQRTCERCGRENPRPRAPICWRCKKSLENERYRSTTETTACARCDRPFDRTRGNKQHRYCSDACHHAAKRERYSGPVKARADFPPDVKRSDVARYKRALRLDPCAYCGERPSGIDHIEPAERHPDRSDWSNWTGCCKRCNETKRALPLLLALPWIPVSRTYHDQRRLLFAQAA